MEWLILALMCRYKRCPLKSRELESVLLISYLSGIATRPFAAPAFGIESSYQQVSHPNLQAKTLPGLAGVPNALPDSDYLVVKGVDVDGFKRSIANRYFPGNMYLK